ncbi:hypothetical protein CCMA1212_002186 [Trichoderma ghanense]|uniref:Uncharacterized protein n=1 Tax=Trichoderma ghanense TaxID=65468 RepID=A0ABY2HBE2_9HYPO
MAPAKEGGAKSTEWALLASPFVGVSFGPATNNGPWSCHAQTFDTMKRRALQRDDPDERQL